MDIKKLTEIFGEWPLKIGKFEKVSFDRFKKDWINTFSEPSDAELREDDFIKNAYYNLELPSRSTINSAGYDFHSPLDFVLDPGEDIMIPTGIRTYIVSGFKLSFYPRSGLGSKYYLRIANTIPVVDSDYYYSKNEGHIYLKIRNEGNRRVSIKSGDKFVQGIFELHGITDNDDATGVRDGGFGSTGA